jgi:hypothetical protein
MSERGCYSTTILARHRRPRRLHHPYAVPRTSLQCVCTRRRNCIEQSSPSSEYAPQPTHFPASHPATIKPTRARTKAALLPPHTVGIIPASTEAGDASRRGGNGEQQIEVACRGADTRQDALADSAPHSSAAWIATVLRKAERGTAAPLPICHRGLPSSAVVRTCRKHFSA